MTGRSGKLILGLAVLAAATASSVPAEQSGLGPVPQAGILLLRNGEAISGKISRVGELYYVALPSTGQPGAPTEWDGGEIRIKADDVEFCCRDLQEGYLRKRADVHSGDVRGHLRLAQWCLHHGLLDPAGRELADALEADPTHPMIGLLERRLKMATEPPPRSAPAKATTDPTPSEEELERLVRGMPPGSVETFTKTIQPLLMNHCAAAGCHGPQSQSRFQLLRTPLGRPPSRRLTQRNLDAVLAWVDREDPAASRLLANPAHAAEHRSAPPIRGPHDPVRKAAFSERQVVHYERMADWVRQLTRRPTPTIPRTVAPKNKPPVQAMPTELPDLDISSLETLGAPDPQPTAAARFGEQTPSVPGSSVKRGAALPVFIPVDPFDPEIFNRRFFPPQPPAKTGG